VSVQFSTKTEPTRLSIVDAARLGSHPGEVALVEVDGLVMSGAATHNTPLALFRMAGPDHVFNLRAGARLPDAP